MVKKACDDAGRELSAEEVLDVFKTHYVDVERKYERGQMFVTELSGHEGSDVKVSGIIKVDGVDKQVEAIGNGPIDAFFSALEQVGVHGFHFLSYSEHALTTGANSRAVAYIQLNCPDGVARFGVGRSHNINRASFKGILSAINRVEAHM